MIQQRNIHLLKFAYDKLNLDLSKLNIRLDNSTELILEHIINLWFNNYESSVIEEEDFEIFTKDEIEELGIEGAEEYEEGHYIYSTGFFRLNFFHPSIKEFFKLSQKLIFLKIQKK